MCGRRIMTEASVMGLPVAPCNGAGTERGSKAIPPGS